MAARPRQSLAGIVRAAEDRVWAVLLETSPYLAPRMREVIAGSPGTVRFPAGLWFGLSARKPGGAPSG